MFNKIIRKESKKCLQTNATQLFPKPPGTKYSSSATFFLGWSQQNTPKQRMIKQLSSKLLTRSTTTLKVSSNGNSEDSENLSTRADKPTLKEEIPSFCLAKKEQLMTTNLIKSSSRKQTTLPRDSEKFSTKLLPIREAQNSNIYTKRCSSIGNTGQPTKLTNLAEQSKPSTLFSTTENICSPTLNSSQLTIQVAQLFKPRVRLTTKNITNTRNYSTITSSKLYSTIFLMKSKRDSSTKNIPEKSYSTKSLLFNTDINSKKISHKLQNSSTLTVARAKNYFTKSLFNTDRSTKQHKLQESSKTVQPAKSYSTKALFNTNKSSKLHQLQKLSNTVQATKNYSNRSAAELKRISPQEAAAHVKPNSVVFVEGVVGTPKVLMNAMYNHVKGNDIKGVTVLDVFSLYPYEGMTLEDDCVRRLSFFVSPYTRPYVNAGKAEYIPLMLNDLPLMFSRRYFSPDVALISVSPPDSDGFVSLGTNVTELLQVIAASKVVIAQVNDKMPRSQGAAIIHVDQIDFGVDVSYDLFTPVSEPVTEVDTTIANLICEELIEDEATLQIGLGKIPEAILSHIKHHKNLGVHTELLTSGILPLIQGGIINNSKKSIDRDIITATLLLGDKALYDFVHNNETVQMKPCCYSNDPAIIRQNHRMTAINTCLEIDLTGQVVSDSLGSSIYSGFGGQVDFMRGAMTSLDLKGKAILALPSRDERTGRSKIVSRLTPGAGVVCTRAHVQHLVTEYGHAELCGRSTRQRAYELIRLAHPDHRERLEKEAYELLGVMPCA